MSLWLYLKYDKGGDFRPVLISKPLSKPAKNCSPSSRSQRSEGWGPSYCSDKDCTLTSTCAGTGTIIIYNLCSSLQHSGGIKAKTPQREAHKRGLIQRLSVLLVSSKVFTLLAGKHCSRTCEGSVFR